MMQEALSSHTRYNDVIAPLDTFKDDELVFEPGTDWLYSSFGYRLLACVLQGASNTRYVDLMDRVVFAAAGMSHTVPDDAWAVIPHRVSGYRIERGTARRADSKDVSENLPAGGCLSTASDLVRLRWRSTTGCCRKHRDNSCHRQLPRIWTATANRPGGTRTRRETSTATE